MRKSERWIIFWQLSFFSSGLVVVVGEGLTRNTAAPKYFSFITKRKKYINTKRQKYKRTQTKLSHLWNLLYSRVLAEKVQHGVSQGATRLQSHLSYVSWEMNDIGHVGNYSPYVISYIVFCCCYCCCWHIICQILFHLARFLYHHLRRKGQWWQCLIWFIP